MSAFSGITRYSEPPDVFLAVTVYQSLACYAYLKATVPAYEA
jgi:hypothetical protein